jgi:hypothetical protein
MTTTNETPRVTDQQILDRLAFVVKRQDAFTSIESYVSGIASDLRQWVAAGCQGCGRVVPDLAPPSATAPSPCAFLIAGFGRRARVA